MTTIFRGLERTLPGERVITVTPKLAQFVDADWRKRTHFHTGRSVSADALNVEQTARGGRIALAGQFISAGVVRGLELHVESAGSHVRLTVSPGIGLTLAGEDVRLTRPLEPDTLDPISVDGFDDVKTFEELRNAATAANPSIIIVTLEPVIIEHLGEQDPRDPSELDPEDVAFRDRQLLDGARLRLFEFKAFFPTASLTGVTPQKLRNRLAEIVFEWESDPKNQGILPWDGIGVGLGLMVLDAPNHVAFVDIHSVARDGGQAVRRRKLLNAPGTRRLWQARFQQFNAHLADLDMALLRTEGLATAFDTLPPIGVLPADMLDVRGDRGEPHLPLPQSKVFPPSFVIESVPVELESLDDYMQSSASLSALSLAASEQVQILVPVKHPAQVVQ